ncbi:putative inosine-uridine preferring nucleoside hydrolase, partial [Reticulomyxa filosa]
FFFFFFFFFFFDKKKIIAIGPLTNLAAAEKLQPGILSKAKSILIMGGTFDIRKGNAHPVSEFNFVCDPSSAKYFFDTMSELARKDPKCGLPEVVLFPLDITTTLDVTDQDLQMLETLVSRKKKLSEHGTHVLDFIRGLLHHQFDTHYRWGYGYNMHMHDPTTVAYLAYSHLFAFKRVPVQIDEQTGMSFYDNRMLSPFALSKDVFEYYQPNSWVCVGAERDKFIYAFIRDMAALIENI